MATITICNIYLPPNKRFTVNQIENLLNQLSSPVLLVRNFNSHNLIWGSNFTENRGRKIEKILADNIIVLNDGSATHFCSKNGSFSCIDLSICHASIGPNLIWEVLPLLLGNGHFPIKINFPTTISNEPNVNRWNIKKANWDYYKILTKRDFADIPANRDADTLINDFTTLIQQAAIESVGYKNTNTHKKTTPWWNQNCKEATKNLKQALNRYKRTKNLDDLIQLKKCRAKARRIVLNSKKESWENIYFDNYIRHSTFTDLGNNSKNEG